MIPAEAVEAAARTLSPAAWGPRMWTFGAPGDRNAAARERHQQESLARARAALEAAAPYMLAEAWDEGGRAATGTHDTGYPTRNPYEASK